MYVVDGIRWGDGSKAFLMFIFEVNINTVY